MSNQFGNRRDPLVRGIDRAAMDRVRAKLAVADRMAAAIEVVRTHGAGEKHWSELYAAAAAYRALI
jgi:hypothetical protein